MATGTTTLAIGSSRRSPAETFLLGTSAAQTTGIPGEQFAVPAGFGDCLVERLAIQVATLATMVANPELLGLQVNVVDTNGVTVDSIGYARWVKTSTTALRLTIEPLTMVLWRTQENLIVIGAQVDTNATPTAVVGFTATVRRLRQRGPLPVSRLGGQGAVDAPEREVFPIR